MNRRGFLASILALGAAAVAPVIARARGIEFAALGKAMALAEIAPVEGNYFVIVHPSAWRSLREYCARGRWEIAWRNYRLARRRGECTELDAKGVVAAFGIEDPIPNGIAPFLGSYESMRFIESPALTRESAAA